MKFESTFQPSLRMSGDKSEAIRHFFRSQHARCRVQALHEPAWAEKGVRLFLVRDDLLHPMIAGNKWWKLKYTLIQAAEEKRDTLVSFGGPYSNHVLALAAAGHLFGFRTVAYIRGDEPRPLNPVLQQATQWGMECIGLDRGQYRRKADPEFVHQLEQKRPGAKLIPEGGTCELAVRGTCEMTQRLDVEADYLCCPVGTGGTLAGMILGARPAVQVLGFAVLKGAAFLEKDVQSLMRGSSVPPSRWTLFTGYHSGGYARVSPELKAFCHAFERRHGLQLDRVYTGKMLYGLDDLIRSGRIPAGSRMLAWMTSNAASPAMARQGLPGPTGAPAIQDC